MKTQDIKNMASAYMQVLQSELEEKKKMDPVGQEDDDIDNDGDVDSTDKYLHNRRKAIAKAMKKEEVEELDELSKDTLTRYVAKAQKQADKAGNSYSRAASRRHDFAPDTPAMAKNAKIYLKRDDGAYLARQKLAKMNKEGYDLEEQTMTVDIDHMGGHDAHAKAHNITIKKTGNTTADATGKKKDLQKYLVKHYDDHEDAKDNHPEVYKEEVENMSMREKLQVQKEAIVEREMTAAEKKKREEIVLAMKDKKDDLEKRYGSRWKDVMYATATKQAMESVDQALSMTKNILTPKESFDTADTKWPVYSKIKENRAAHYKGAAPGDPKMMDKMTASDKAFIDAHSANDLDGIDSGINGAKAAEDTAKNAAAQVKAGAGMNRTGDQKTGDKNIVKSTEAK